MNFSDDRLRQLHEVLLEILSYVEDICTKNDLKFFIIAGTTLGAYRHQGFIPWDDDLDIALIRDDYDKMLKIIREDNNSIFSVQDQEEEEKYFLPFAKVRKNGTVFKERVAPNIYNNEGIYIDVFPVDTLDEVRSIKTKIRMKTIKFLSHVLRFRTCKPYFKEIKTFAHYSISCVMCLPFIPFSNKKILQYQRKLMTARNSKEVNYLISFGSIYECKRELLPVEMCYPLKKIRFENKELWSFGNVEEYLEQLYGNYMQLPPEEKRHSHEPLILKF